MKIQVTSTKLILQTLLQKLKSIARNASKLKTEVLKGLAWITPGIKSSICKKHSYYKLWKKSKCKDKAKAQTETTKAYYEKYKSYRRYLKRIIKGAKRTYYSKRFENAQGNLKKTWSLINELRGKSKRNINVIVNTIQIGHFVMFADDTYIFVVGENEETALENANIVLNKISTYMFQNLLHINLDKSVYMHFRPNLNISERLTCARSRPYGSEPVLKIAGHKLKKVNKVKFLGVIIDDKLNWKLILSKTKFKRYNDKAY